MTVRTFLTTLPVVSGSCCISNGRSQRLSNTQELIKSCTDTTSNFSDILDLEIKKIGGYGKGIKITI